MSQIISSIILVLFFIIALPNANADSSDITQSKEFKDYWYSGTAEITSYDLEQARYGKLHKGHAVLIFVTEDFSNSKHVKLDNPASAKEDAVKVLKLNRVKKFNTGIYPYSMMDSVFTPVDSNNFPNTLKLTSSSQEWCGSTFTQINLQNDSYNLESFSYFESEGDRNFNLDKAVLEDELWARIKLGPDSLPEGDVKLIPGAMSARLRHIELKVESAKASLTVNLDNEDLLDYYVLYIDSGRSLKITFSKDFPYIIESWEETYKSGFGGNAKKLTTRATRNKTIKSDYWKKHNPEDVVLRKELGL